MRRGAKSVQLQLQKFQKQHFDYCEFILHVMVVTAQDLVKVCKIYSTINKQIISCVNMSGECGIEFFRSRL